MFTDRAILEKLAMKKQELIEILKKLLETDTDMEFLRQLNDEDLQTLVACVRGRVDQGR